MVQSDRPIFVVGTPRSGTHLLRFCLSRHSRIFIGPETGLFIQVLGSRLLDAVVPWPRRGSLLVDRMLHRHADPTMSGFLPRRDEIVQALSGCRSYREFATGFLAALAVPSGKPRWGEKTALHALCLDQIFALFPNAQVVFTTREPKATIGSIMKSSHVRMNFDKAIATYYRIHEIAQHHKNNSRVCFVSYEALTADPEGTLRDVCLFLGEEFEAAMLSPGMIDSSYGDVVMRIDENIGIQPNDPQKWRRALSDQQGQIVDRILRGRSRIGLVRRPRLFYEYVRLMARFAGIRFGVFGLRLFVVNTLRGRVHEGAA